jgi:hypothetical protein
MMNVFIIFFIYGKFSIVFKSLLQSEKFHCEHIKKLQIGFKIELVSMLKVEKFDFVN